MPQSDWTVHDLGAPRGFYATRPDGARIDYLHGRTDGDERVSFYGCVLGGVSFQCRVVERGDPKVIQPKEMTFIFDSTTPRGVEPDVVEAIGYSEWSVSAGRRDASKARITIERDA